MKLTDEQLMDILKEAVKAIAVKYNSIVAENEGQATNDTEIVTMEVAPKEIPKKMETPVHTEKPVVENKPLAKNHVQETKTEEVTNVVGKPTNNDPNPPQNTREILEGMSYNELKVLAKETGVKAIGSKLSLIDKILEAQANSVDPKTDMTTEQIEDSKEEVETYVATPKEDTEYEEVEDYEEESIEDEEEEENLYTKLVRETMDMSDEEIADLLADVGISPKGRRQALLSKLEQAVRDGLIALDDEEEKEEDTVEMNDEPSTEDVAPQQEDTVEEIEIAGSEERVAKVSEVYDRYLQDYLEGGVSDSEIKDFLKDYYNSNAEYAQIVETYTNEEMAEHYALIHAQLVDDEGEEYDFGEPYIVDDEYWCSGQPMKMLDENTLYDEVTGEEFQLD